MTPEELNRTIDFIVTSQARLVVAQEQDRQHRIEFEEWSQARDTKLEAMNGRLERLVTRVVQLQDQQAQLLVHQSDRMDRLEKLHEDTQDFQRQALNLLHMLLDRLPPPSSN